MQSALQTGAVVATRWLSEHGQLWRVEFEDGDRDELDWEQLRDCLLPAAAEHVGSGLSTPQATGSPAAPADVRAPRKYKGVAFHRETRSWRMDVDLPGGRRIAQRNYADAETAARAYDDAVRRCGIVVVNFPRDGTGEVQAVAGEPKAQTLARAGISQPARCRLSSGHARAAGAASSIPARMKLQPRSCTVPGLAAAALPAARGADARASAAAPAPEQRRSVAGGGSGAPHPMYLHGYCGVYKPADGGGFRAQFVLPGGKSRLFLGGDFATAADAARAHDVEARRQGALHRINFPKNAAEREASSEYRRVGPNTYNALQRSRAAAAAAPASAVPAPRKRGRLPRAQQLAGSARKNARVEEQEEQEDDESGGDDAAAGGCSDMDADAADVAPPPARSAHEDRRQLPVPVPTLPAPPATAAPAAPAPAAAPAAGAPQSELQRVEAFLRGIRPPLSQARMLACLNACCVRALKRASSLMRPHSFAHAGRDRDCGAACQPLHHGAPCDCGQHARWNPGDGEQRHCGGRRCTSARPATSWPSSARWTR
jgi:hypothetical protein